jgi:hypothetical protein
MSLLFPGFLAAVVMAAIPIALHVFRRWPRTPVVFPSHMFLSAARRRSETWWQRLRRWLVLALRCAVMAMLGLGFARPFLRGNRASERQAVIVVVDNSFSLQARGRWDTVKHWAIGELGTVGAGDKVGVLQMAPEPNWVLPPTDDAPRALAVLRASAPGWYAARIEPALRLAAETLQSIPASRRRLIVLTDHQQLSWSGTDFAHRLPAGIAASFPQPAPAPGSQAAVLPPVLRPREGQLLATVRIRHFAGPRRRTLQVYRDGAPTPVREETVDLPAGGTRSVAIPLPMPAGTAVRYRFSLDADDLPADDVAYAVWRSTAKASVLLDSPPPTDSADFVAHALLAASGTNAQSLEVSPLPEVEWSPHATVVLRNDGSFTGDVAARLEAFLAAGGSALMFATGGPNQTRWLQNRDLLVSPLAPGSDRGTIRRWSIEHPFVAELARRRLEVLLGWTFNEGWSLAADRGTPLAYWTDGTPAMVEARIGDGRVILCGFRPDRSSGDWPVTPSFVPFVHQATVYLCGVQQAATREGIVGRVLHLGPATGKWRAIEGRAATDGAQTVVGSVVPTSPGIYEFTSGTDRLLCAVNVAPEESDLAPWQAGAPWRGLVSVTDRPENTPSFPANADSVAAEAEQKSPLWWWVAALCACLWLLELGLANRTGR